jgi:TonB family protein
MIPPMNFFKYLFVFITIPAPAICLAQHDTTYLDNDFKPTIFDNAEYYRVTHKEPDGRYKIADHYLNNKLQMEGYFSDLKQEIKDGFFVFYDRHGSRESQGNYTKNKPEGKWEQYYDSSAQLWYSENFIDGEPDGELVSYYKSGKIKRREFHKIKDTTVTGKCYDENGSEIPFTKFEAMPVPAFDYNTYLNTQIRYPEYARRKNIQGRVLVRFVVNEDGSISDVIPLNHIGGGCDEEAARVVSAMPKWKPGIRDDKPAKVYFTLPILFKLE